MRATTLLRLLLLLAVLALLYWLGLVGMTQARDSLAALAVTQGSIPVLALGAGLLVVLLALPFVPALEIGVLLMILFGVPGVVTVYLCAVLGLCLSFGLGRVIPFGVLLRLFGWLGLRRARELTARMRPLRGEEALEMLVSRAPNRLVPFLLRHRYVALAVLFNLPGNAVLGAGGGIGVLAGLSGLFAFPRYLLTLLVATLPLPVLFLGSYLLFG